MSQGALSGAQFKGFKGPGRRVIVAKLGDEEVGRMSLTENTGIPGEHVVEDVWVHHDHRRKGIGTDLWNEAKRKGLNPVHDEGDQTEAGAAWARKVGS